MPCGRRGCWRRSSPVPGVFDPEVMKKITSYAKLFWANRGNHNENTAQKFIPSFYFDEFRQAALTAQKNGAFKTAYADLEPVASEDALNKELDDIKAAIFDPNFEPMVTAKSPSGGKDILQASSNTFYPGLSLNDFERFQGITSIELSDRARQRGSSPRAGVPCRNS